MLQRGSTTATAVGEAALPSVMALVMRMQKSPNGRAIAPFLQTLAPVAKRLQSHEQLQRYLDVTLDFMARTTVGLAETRILIRAVCFEKVEGDGVPRLLFEAARLDGARGLVGFTALETGGAAGSGAGPTEQEARVNMNSRDDRIFFIEFPCKRSTA